MGSGNLWTKIKSFYCCHYLCKSRLLISTFTVIYYIWKTGDIFYKKFIEGHNFNIVLKFLIKYRRVVTWHEISKFVAKNGLIKVFESENLVHSCILSTLSPYLGNSGHVQGTLWTLVLIIQEEMDNNTYIGILVSYL